MLTVPIKNSLWEMDCTVPLVLSSTEKVVCPVSACGAAEAGALFSEVCKVVEEGALLETLGFSEEEFRGPFPKKTRHGKSRSNKKNKTSKAMVPFKVKSGSFLFYS